MYKTFISKTLAAFLTIFIGIGTAILVSAQTTDDATSKETSATTSSNQGEPLLLLLFGLAVFIGATTVKRKKSSVR